jgi:hypothetical protein
MSLPPHVRAEVKRILDGAARRLLADELDRDAIGAATGSDDHLGDGGPNQGAPLVDGEPVPVLRRLDGDGGPLAA